MAPFDRPFVTPKAPRLSIGWVAASMLLIFATSLQAGVDAEPVSREDDIPFVADEYEHKVDEIHDWTSDWLLSTAVWLDSFFDDERYLLEENATRAKLRLTFDYSRFDDFEFTPRISLRLRLPKLSQKTFLTIGLADGDAFDTADDSTPEKPDSEENETDDWRAAISYFLRAGRNDHLTTTLGASWDYLYAGLRYRYAHDFGRWQGRVTDTLRYYTDDGLENKVSLDVERHFSRNWFFRTTASADWYEKSDGLHHALHLRFYQVLNRHQALQYEVGNYFNTQPSYKMTDLLFKVRYRQRFYRDWLVLEVAPRVSFPYEHNREPDPGIALRLEADFGYRAGEDVFRTVFGF